MFGWLRNLASQTVKFPGLKYGAPKLMYPPEEQANKPVVILFGWLGASERHLSKYTKLYQDKGYETIHYIPPMSIIIFPHKIPDMNAQIQGDLVRIMREKQLLRRPFLLHLFSNSGYINWCYFQKHIQKNLPNNAFNIYYKIHGTVIDSAPCKLDPQVLSRGFIGALFPKVANHKHWLLTPVFEKFWSLYINSPLNKQAFETTNKMMDNSILPFPQFFMFSEGDTMIYSSEIKKHIERIQRKSRLPIQSVDFGTSDHVAHYRMHPAAYSKRIDAVLTRVEKGWTALMNGLALHGHTPRLKRSKPRTKRVKQPTL